MGGRIRRPCWLGPPGLISRRALFAACGAPEGSFGIRISEPRPDALRVRFSVRPADRPRRPAGHPSWPAGQIAPPPRRIDAWQGDAPAPLVRFLSLQRPCVFAVQSPDGHVRSRSRRDLDRPNRRTVVLAEYHGPGRSGGNLSVSVDAPHHGCPATIAPTDRRRTVLPAGVRAVPFGAGVKGRSPRFARLPQRPGGAVRRRSAKRCPCPLAQATTPGIHIPFAALLR